MNPRTEELGLLVLGTQRAWRYALDQRLKPLGLSQGKWTTLVHLARGGNGRTQTEVAERIGIEGATLVGILDRLEKDGWIERRAGERDRRSKTVHLRAKADATLKQIFQIAARLRGELLKDIPGRDLDACIRVLDRIQQRAENLNSSL